MKWFLALVVISSTVAFAQNNGGATQDLSTLHGVADPPMLGIHWARGVNPNARVDEAAAHQAGPRKSVNMTYHGGKIMQTAVTMAIYWGQNWSNSTFVCDNISGLDT